MCVRICVRVCQGCHKKHHRLGSLNNKSLLLTILEARSLKPRGQQDWFLPRPFSLMFAFSLCLHVTFSSVRLCSNFLFLWEHWSSSSRAHPYNIIFTLIIPFNVQSPNIVTFKVLGVRAWTNEFVSGGHTIHYTTLCLSVCVVSLNCSFTFLYGFLLLVAFFFFNLCTFEKSAFWVLQLLSL